MKKPAGFTMIELVTTMIIIGILAAVVVPRIDASSFRAVEFRDSTVAALRYAQKIATSHRRLVCVSFTAATVKVDIARQHDASSCDSPLPLPAGTATVTSRDTKNVLFDPVPDAIYFQPDGRGTADSAGSSIANPTLTITGGIPISVAGTTGHVE